MGEELYFEDFSINDEFKSRAKVVLEKDIDAFAELSGDMNPIHADSEFAQKNIYGERIAHGLLVLSLVSGLAVELGIAERTTIAFRGLDWKFSGPIFIGDKIRTIFKVIKKRGLTGVEGGLVVFKVKVLNQDDKIVQMGKWSLIIKNREVI